MEPIEFRVPALPVAQPRPKARAFGGHAQIYEAKKSHPIHDYKASVRMAARQAYKGAPLEGPLLVTLEFVFQAKKKKRVPKVTKPDSDNLAKSTLDAMNKLTFKDDGQVVSLHVIKWHAAKDEQPHVLVRIEAFTV